MPNADFFLASLTQKARIPTFPAKMDQSGHIVFQTPLDQSLDRMSNYLQQEHIQV